MDSFGREYVISLFRDIFPSYNRMRPEVHARKSRLKAADLD